MILLLRNIDTFHEHRPGGIYNISEIVSHIVLMTINSEGYFESASSYDINEQWRLIEHIDIVVGTDDSKKNMSVPTVMRSNSFKYYCRMFDVPHVSSTTLLPSHEEAATAIASSTYTMLMTSSMVP
jgi:hypothetical protein